MGGESPTYPEQIKSEQLYEQICDSYRAIDDFRAKLLGFLPLASGTGISLLLGSHTNFLNNTILPIGVFGAVITLGLFVYEIYGIEKCTDLIKAGKQLEGIAFENKIESSKMYKGQFLSRPDGILGRRGPLGLINEIFAAGIIYPAVFAAWIYLALFCERFPIALVSSVLVFVLGFAVSYRYNYLLQKMLQDESESPVTKSGAA